MTRNGSLESECPKISACSKANLLADIVSSRPLILPVPVPREDLPVTLPLDLTFTEDQGGNPLANHEKFCKVKCPECGNEARRETDTMDTFYDSSWYFMRFCDADNSELPFSRKSVDYWMGGGVDLYIGGIEHAVMHLLYARFFTKATRDLPIQFLCIAFTFSGNTISSKDSSSSSEYSVMRRNH